jgi:hypothetical protein
VSYTYNQNCLPYTACQNNTVGFNGSCLFGCPSNYNFLDNNICVKTCPIEKYIHNINNKKMCYN